MNVAKIDVNEEKIESPKTLDRIEFNRNVGYCLNDKEFSQSIKFRAYTTQRNVTSISQMKCSEYSTQLPQMNCAECTAP